MPGSTTASSVVLPVIVSDLLVEAAAEISVARFGGTLEPGVAAGLLSKFNRIVDLYNVNPLTAFAVAFTQYTPVLGNNYQTFGPSSANWASDPRPAKILAANVVLNTSTPAVKSAIRIQDSVWWQNQSVPTLQAAFPTDLYYDADFGTDGNGKVYLWPVPTVAYPIEIKTDKTFGGYKSTDTLWLPPGYRELLTLELAVKSAPSLGQVVSRDLRRAYVDARSTVLENNVEIRNVRTRDGGMPGAGSGRRYLYRTGLFK